VEYQVVKCKDHGCILHASAPPLSRLASDATAMSDDATTLHESIKPHPMLKPCNTSLPRINFVNKGDARRSSSEYLQPEPTSKDDAHKWENNTLPCDHPT
jgi:hypothetical protein